MGCRCKITYDGNGKGWDTFRWLWVNLEWNGVEVTASRVKHDAVSTVCENENFEFMKDFLHFTPYIPELGEGEGGNSVPKQRKAIVTSSAPTYDHNFTVTEMINVKEQADWKDDTDDESEEQELEAHYMYMAQLQEVTPDSVDTSGPIFDDEPMHKVQNNNDNVFAMENEHPEQPESSNDIFLRIQGTPISLLIHRIYVMIELRMTRMKLMILDQDVICLLLYSETKN
ncbi:hypothetical protein Tco_0128168 [Tanacetum coccineum]